MMSDRHVPRLCDLCQAPMARQEAACWDSGTQWAEEEIPRTALRVIAGGAGRGDPEPDVRLRGRGDTRRRGTGRHRCGPLDHRRRKLGVRAGCPGMPHHSEAVRR